MSAPASQEKRRIPLAEAIDLATDVVGLMSPFCELIKVAGSIRRQSVKVGDIEIVCTPRFEDRAVGMFEDQTERVNLQLERVNQLIAEGVFSKRIHKNGSSTCGAGSQYLWYKEFALDIFGVIDPSQFGVIFAIRTGPEPFSHHKLVKTHHNGGFLLTGQRVQGGQLWDRGVALVTPDEETFFKQIGKAWIRPEDRN